MNKELESILFSLSNRDEIKKALEALRPDEILYVVKNEHTLGYLSSGACFMGVLRGSVRKGGHNELNGPVSFFGSKIRIATIDDFEEYMVMLPHSFRYLAVTR